MIKSSLHRIVGPRKKSANMNNNSKYKEIHELLGYSKPSKEKSASKSKYIDRKRKSLNDNPPSKCLRLISEAKSPIWSFDVNSTVYRSTTPMEHYQYVVSSKNSFSHARSPTDFKNPKVEQFNFDNESKWHPSQNKSQYKVFEQH